MKELKIWYSLEVIIILQDLHVIVIEVDEHTLGYLENGVVFSPGS